jgi:hypothetical protein
MQSLLCNLCDACFATGLSMVIGLNAMLPCMLDLVRVHTRHDNVPCMFDRLHILRVCNCEAT